MKLFGKDLDSDVAIVAEIGVNHEGDVDAASKLLRLAAEAGADAAKFQSYSADRLASADDPERLARVRRFALDEAAQRRLAGEASKLGIAFFSSAITEDAVPLIAELSPAIKIASGDLDFEPVIRAAAATGRPVILSTGIGTLDEVDRAVGWVRDEIGGASLADRLVLMQCVSAYPAPVNEANAAAVPLLRRRYGVPVGYSNHVIGPDACYAALALGASLIEVHFTDRKDGRSFRDHALSFEPGDLKDLVERAPRIRAAVGQEAKAPQPCEAGSVKAIRKGLVAARDLAAGTILAREDLMFARPATEFGSGEIGSLVGRKLREPARRGELIRRSAVAAG
jgi:N-acetylneuraminate synthase/N,N'-diacetyllegionaminate synthase